MWGILSINVHALVMHWEVLQVRQHSIQSTMQHKYFSVLITLTGFSASEPEVFFLFLFLADNENRLKVKICIDFHWLCSCLLSWTSENYLEWDEENMLAAVSRGELWFRWWTRTCLHFNTERPFGNWDSKNRTAFWNMHTNIAR